MEAITSEAKLLKQYRDIRKKTLHLCEPLMPEDYVVQPIVDVSPPKWHLGHTTWFFETFILSKYLPGYKVFHKDFSFIFNSYYESVGERVFRADRGNLTRPTTEEVKIYRKYVDEHIEKLFEIMDPSSDKELELFFTIGLNHEQQHQELLLTDLKYILGHNPLFPVYRERETHIAVESPKVKYISVSGGLYEIGYGGDGFAWDNERPEHKFYIDDFKIRNTLVTNKEYIEFMTDDAYKDFRHWHSEAWELIKTEGWQAPLYWHKLDDEWHQYTLAGLKKVDPNEPVTHISFYEAEAFASWAGKRLLREEEWEIAAQQLKTDETQALFVESKFYHPIAPIALEGNDICHQLFGNTWEWTYSGYFPYPGYRQAEGALGEYNGKFMINQMVLRGGSCATPREHFRSTYRNFFHADKRWQFTGIRLAE